MRPVVVLALLVLAPSSSFASTPVPACTRVLPGVSFPHRQLLDRQSVGASARLGRDGERGLVVVEYRSETRAYVLRSGTPDGMGGLAFGPEVQLVSPRFLGPNQVVAGDFDGDGRDDAAIWWTGYGRSAAALDLLLGQDGGGFVTVMRWFFDPGSVLPEPLGVGDFDGDGRTDLAFFAHPCEGCEDVQLSLLGFDEVGQPVVRVAAGVGSVEQATPVVVDWNGDGIDDVLYLIAGGEWSPFGVTYGDRDAPFSISGSEYLPYPTLQLVALDRKLVALEGTRYWWFVFPTAIHQPFPGEYPVGDAFRIDLPQYSGLLSPSLDLDGDGAQDLLASDLFDVFGGGSEGFDVWWGGASGTPEAGPRSIGTPRPIAMMDLDGDGVRDLVTSEFGAVLQSRDLRFDEGLRGATVTTGTNDEPYAFLTIGDVNEDGLDDVVTQTAWADGFALSLAKGDGAFEVTPFDVDIWSFRIPVLHDLDGDGHLDLAAENGGRSVAWGHGDGTFGPWDVQADPPGHSTYRRFGDLDGDRITDVVEFSFDGYAGPAAVHTALAGNRTWREGTADFALPSADYAWVWTLADLDGDGRDDLVIPKRTAPWSREAVLVWRRSLGDGTFGDEQRIEPSDTVQGIATVTPADFDLDGTADLFVVTDARYPEQTRYLSLRNAGGGVFEKVWTSEPIPYHYGLEDRLADVDGDGRPDLVYGMYDPLYSPSYLLRVRRGDGLGGFLPPEPTTWAAPAGVPGRFRTTGRDLARLRQRDLTHINLEVLPTTGHTLEADVAPPDVEVTLFPVVDVSQLPARFDSRWRVATVPLDECDSHPRVVRRVVSLLPLASDAPVTFRRAASMEVRVYEVPGTLRREVLLLGPDEAAARRALADAIANGGFSFEHYGTLQLGTTAAYAPERGPRDAASRLVQRFVLDGARLIVANQTRSGDELTFAVDASDAAGHRGTTRVRFDAARDAAMAKACADPEIARYVCR